MFSFDISNADWWIVLLAIFALILVRIIIVSIEYFGENKRTASLISMVKELDGISMNEQEELEYLKFREHVFRSLPKNKQRKKTITPLFVCMIVWAALSVLGFVIGIHVVNLALLLVVMLFGGLIGNVAFEIGLIKGRAQEAKDSLEQMTKQRIEDAKNKKR